MATTTEIMNSGGGGTIDGGGGLGSCHCPCQNRSDNYDGGGRRGEVDALSFLLPSINFSILFGPMTEKILLSYKINVSHKNQIRKQR